MKVYILSLILLISSLAHADDLSFVKGGFNYTSSEIISTKHIRQLYSKSKKERDLIKDYRSFGYECSPKSSQIVECKKIISTNPHQIEPKNTKTSLLNPYFADVQKVELINEGDFTVTYNVEQNTNLNEFSSEGYKAYKLNNSGLYIDLKTNPNSKLRFQVLNQNTLTHFSFEREKISKREFFIHGVSHIYLK
jgi:hypothetical protein